jgi:prevent-host-death family protein
MERVGVRELRQQASAILRRVKTGERVEITEHGVPVAVLIKYAPPGLARLKAEGRLTPAEGDALDFEPIPLEPGEHLPSELVSEGRED